MTRRTELDDTQPTSPRNGAAGAGDVRRLHGRVHGVEQRVRANEAEIQGGPGEPGLKGTVAVMQRDVRELRDDVGHVRDNLDRWRGEFIEWSRYHTRIATVIAAVALVVLGLVGALLWKMPGGAGWQAETRSAPSATSHDRAPYAESRPR